MDLVWAILIAAGATAVAVAAMLYVRRRAPSGSYFADGDRAAGVFGVLATGFAVLLGFVVFLSFESFDTSRAGAETEAELVLQQFETAQLLPPASRATLSGQLVCYARAVVRGEWPGMESGTLGDVVNPWVVAMFRTTDATEPETAAEQAGFAKWLDQRSERETARSDRVHGAEGVIPAPLWIVLFLSAGVIFVFMLFFADPAEARRVQMTMMGGVVLVITSTLLLLWFLDNPYHRGIGGLRPVAMERTLGLLEGQIASVVEPFETPCDARGDARTG
jgi:amino acid transporter